VAGLYGCATTESEQAGTTPGATPSSTAGKPSTSGTARAPVDKGAGMSSGTAGAARPDLKRSVYYEFDKYDVKAEYRSLVESHAAWLRANPKARLTIEGNADERGSREYNVALGQRRAESVMKMMRLLGAAENQIEAVSFGEEKPRAQAHDDASWAENRRSDFRQVK
jgi:peptidoglycan-associated lipoprotein